MGDENSEMMNLDLNLTPSSSPDMDSRSEPLDFIERRFRSRVRERRRYLLAHNITNRADDVSQTGEGSERNDDVAKECKKDEISVENERNKEEEEKGSGESENGSFFDCNICLDLSSDPVLTCCGHLFCWPCLHQWLNVHSDAKECPVCKGEVMDKNLTPIYGRGSKYINTHEQKTNKPSLEIPDRPRAQRVESWRQIIQRNSYAIPTVESLDELAERNGSLVNRMLTSRGMRQEQATTNVPPEEIIEIDLTRNNTRTGSEAEARRVEAYLRRSHTYRSAPTAELANMTQRLIESYMRYTNLERSPDQPLPVDDRDSVSSIAAVIHSESQVDIDSMVSLSTSSSRMRVDGSRVADVDSGDSRAPRRRRLN